jgi:Tfp pilus assembly protein PilX
MTTTTPATCRPVTTGARRRCSLRREDGILMIVVMIFLLIFAILGGALYWLVYSQTRATDTERVDVKSFNVSEAGIDAGMLTLRLNWPLHSTDDATAAVTAAALKTALQAANPGLWDPKRSLPANFLKVSIYDNVDSSGQTTTVAYNQAPHWDSNADGMMFVDATANVGDDRHRILILAEKQQWQLSFPTGLALWASAVDSNGQGFQVSIEDGTPPVYYDVHDALHKGVDPQPPANVLPATQTDWKNVVSPSTQAALLKIAQDQHTYFSGATAEADATAFLTSGKANGKVVYIKSDTAVTISGNTQVGTVEEPVVVVFDTPDGTVNAWDFKGTGDFYGIMLTIGDNELRGTSAMHGAAYCKGTFSNKGNGSCGEILYNQKVIDNVNRQYVIDVNIVPNTWEEYTTPST